MTSKSIYLPYFYIIQHKLTKKMYAGSRWAKGCHPDEFMQPNGYTTSSKIIIQIIEREGLDSFEILRIDSNLDDLTALEYETSFLQNHNCTHSNDWYNMHDNAKLSYTSMEYTSIMLERYGVVNPMQVPKFKNKQSNTMLTRYGAERPMQIVEFKIKRTNTLVEKYGYEFISQVPEIKAKIIQNNQEKYGVDSHHQRQSVKDKKKATNQEKYGVDNVLQSIDIRNTIKETNLKLYGVEYPSSQLKFLSIIETKKTYAKNIASKLFPELKQFY